MQSQSHTNRSIDHLTSENSTFSMKITIFSYFEKRPRIAQLTTNTRIFLEMFSGIWCDVVFHSVSRLWIPSSVYVRVCVCVRVC